MFLLGRAAPRGTRILRRQSPYGKVWTAIAGCRRNCWTDGSARLTSCEYRSHGPVVQESRMAAKKRAAKQQRKVSSKSGKSGSGEKRALCVGINDYPGTGNDLSGCVN